MVLHGPSFSEPATETRPTYPDTEPVLFAATVTAALTAAFKLEGPEKHPPDASAGMPEDGVPVV
jgi:hypothetical protein